MFNLTRIKFAGHVARMSEKGNAYKLLLCKPGGKRPAERPRLSWVHYIKMDPAMIRCGAVK
jgi:hypothetical protein